MPGAVQKKVQLKTPALKKRAPQPADPKKAARMELMTSIGDAKPEVPTAKANMESKPAKKDEKKNIADATPDKTPAPEKPSPAVPPTAAPPKADDKIDARTAAEIQQENLVETELAAVAEDKLAAAGPVAACSSDEIAALRIAEQKLAAIAALPDGVPSQEARAGMDLRHSEESLAEAMQAPARPAPAKQPVVDEEEQKPKQMPEEPHLHAVMPEPEPVE